MINKIITINKNLVASGRKDAAFNPGEVSILESLREILEASKPVPPQAIDLVVRLLTTWPPSDRLAGLDLLRCIVKWPAVAQYSDSQGKSALSIAIAASSGDNTALPSENSTMMGVRTVVNLFTTADGRSVVNSQANEAISFIERITGVKGGHAIGKHNRNVLIAVTTMLVNYSVLVHKEKLLLPEQRRRLLLVIGVILKDQTDSEVLYRALVALGTFLSASTTEAKGLGVKAWLQIAAEKSTEDRAIAVANECSRVVPQS